MKKTLLTLALVITSFSSFANNGEIRFATEPTYPPFEYVDDNGEKQGFDIDLANALCAELDMTCSFHTQSFDSIIPTLKFHKFDAAISGMDITKERLKQVSFTASYFANAAVFVTTDPAIKTLEGLKGKKVGVQNGTTHQKYVLDNMPGVISVPYANYQEAFMDMKAGRVVSVFGDTAVVADIMRKEGQGVVKLGDNITDPNYFGNGFGIAVAKDSTELLEKLNSALQKVKANGTYDKLYNKYFE